MYINVKSKGEILQVIIDDEDYPKVARYTWWIKHNNYVFTNTRGAKKRTSIYLHRLILSAPNGFEVDHKNNNPLDNRKENLRLCTRSQNGMNKSGVRGVSKFRDKWRARIKIDKKEKHIGIYDTYEEALQARQKVELETFKEFSNLWQINPNTL